MNEFFKRLEKTVNQRTAGEISDTQCLAIIGGLAEDTLTDVRLGLESQLTAFKAECDTTYEYED